MQEQLAVGTFAFHFFQHLTVMLIDRSMPLWTEEISCQSLLRYRCLTHATGNRECLVVYGSFKHELCPLRFACFSSFDLHSSLKLRSAELIMVILPI